MDGYDYIDFEKFEFPAKTGEDLYISSYKICEWGYINCDKCKKIVASTPQKNLPIKIKIVCMECEIG